MLKFKTLFPYIFGLASLLISLGIMNQGRLVEAGMLPSPTPSATALTQRETSPGAARWANCLAVSKPRFFFYVPSETNEMEDQITITGTIYASNLVPLSDVIVEIWRTDPEQQNNAYLPPPRRYIRTDEAGRYEFTTMRPDGPNRSYLHYQIGYKDYCPLLLHLHVVTEASPQPAQQRSAFTKVVEVTGPVLQGPVDIVLPVPPPKP